MENLISSLSLHPLSTLPSLRLPPPSILCRLSVFWSGVSISKGSLWGPPVILLTLPPFEKLGVHSITTVDTHTHTQHWGTCSQPCWQQGPIVPVCTHGGNQYVCTVVSKNRFLVDDDTLQIQLHCYYYPDTQKHTHTHTIGIFTNTNMAMWLIYSISMVKRPTSTSSSTATDHLLPHKEHLPTHCAHVIDHLHNIYYFLLICHTVLQPSKDHSKNVFVTVDEFVSSVFDWLFGQYNVRKYPLKLCVVHDMCCGEDCASETVSVSFWPAKCIDV